MFVVVAAVVAGAAGAAVAAVAVVAVVAVIVVIVHRGTPSVHRGQQQPYCAKHQE